jgi:tryptophan synthase alpha chain
MSTIDRVFQRLRASGRKAFMPFITAGDPDLDFTIAVIRELASRGCTLCELGVPYSDPIADGPVIQASYTRALQRHIKLEHILRAVAELSSEVTMPLIAMVSYAVVYRQGLEQFIRRAKQAGIAGAIVPDLPFEEATSLAKLCRREDLSLIQLVAPTTPRERALRIAATTTGFLYYVSVTGITGERSTLPSELVENVAWLRDQTSLPICIGFGISQPEHVRALAPVADGLIVGSAFVRRVAQAANTSRAGVLSQVGQYASSLLTALQNAES